METQRSRTKIQHPVIIIVMLDILRATTNYLRLRESYCTGKKLQGLVPSHLVMNKLGV